MIDSLAMQCTGRHIAKNAYPQRMKKIALAVLFLFLPINTALAGDGSPPPSSIDVIVSPIQNVVPEVSVPPSVSDPNTRLVLPPCSGVIKNDCLVSLEYSYGNGIWVKGSFIESAPLRNLSWKTDNYKDDFSVDDQVIFAKPIPNQNFPAGGRSSIWQLKGAKHSKSDLYAATISFPGEVSDRNNPRASSTNIKWMGDLKILIGTYNGSEINESRACSGFFVDASFSCQFVNKSKFPENIKFRIKANFLKTRNILENSPWLIGHIINSKIGLASQPDGSQILSIEGSPTISGMVTAKFAKSAESYKTYREALETLHKIYVGDKYAFDYSYEAFNSDQGSMGLGSSTPGVVESWSLIEKIAPFNYLNEEEIWLVKNTKVSPSDYVTLNNCDNGKLAAGLIATNAIGANPRPPVYDKETGELVYSVASPHLKNNGSLNVGFYEISIDQKLGQCLWGKEFLKYQVSISVVSLDGIQKVTTSNVALRDGLITFRAAGFTYSANSIRVKMKDVGAVSPINSELADFIFGDDRFPSEASKAQTVITPMPKVLKPKTSIITCIKGKLSKKVTAVNPKCPSGYRKK